MKTTIKMTLITAIAAMVLTGCGTNTVRENTSLVESLVSSTTVNEESTNSSVETTSVETTSNEENSTSEATEPTSEETSSTTKETTSSSTIEEKPTTSTTTTSTSSTVTKPTEKPAVSSSSSSKPVSSSSKPVSSSSKPTSTTTKPVSSTTSSSSTTTTKPTEKPTHTHNFTNATCTTPATCKICGATKGTVANHNYKDGHCTYCGKSDPNYVAPHNCKNDGHVWGKSYTETSTENVEIVETHILSNNGYDYDLAERYFGRGSSDTHFSDIFGCEWGSGSSKVKTTGVKTITRYIHECSECGYKEVYNTEETVTPGDNWVFAIKPRSQFFPVIWYDINNIPDEVYEGLANLQEWEKANGF